MAVRASRQSVKLDTHDMQRLLLNGYGYHPWASYWLLHIEDVKAARHWIGRLLDRGLVTFDEAEKKADREPAPGVNLAFTSRGLARLGLETTALASFPRAFRQGMVTEHRSRLLGDTNKDTWRWGVPGKDVDVLLMLFVKTEEELAGQWERLEPPTLRVATVENAWLPPKGEGPFDFADGISQPVIEGTAAASDHGQGKGEPRQTLLDPGELVLGYPDGLGKIAGGPAVEADPENLLPRLLDGRGDLGRNGSYLVVRQMDLGTEGFTLFYDDEEVTRKVVGRHRDGRPLVKGPASAHSEGNDFGFRDDPDGLTCPIGAHMRRANPRDSFGRDPRKTLKSVNRHRILRRGRLYKDAEHGPGLFFICLNSDIERQFEFVQAEWINHPFFGGLDNEVDPLIGLDGRTESRDDMRFTLPGDPVRRRVPVQSFVTVTGGAYFFLPGRRALRYLAGL